MRVELAIPLVITLFACSSGDGGATGSGGGSGASSSSSAGTGGTKDTWTNYAEGFAAMYCVECHNASDAARDYTKLADVQKDAAEVRCGVAPTKLSGCVAAFPPPKQFPISDAKGTNPKPTDAERDRFVAWIEAGLPP